MHVVNLGKFGTEARLYTFFVVCGNREQVEKFDLSAMLKEAACTTNLPEENLRAALRDVTESEVYDAKNQTHRRRALATTCHDLDLVLIPALNSDAKMASSLAHEMVHVMLSDVDRLLDHPLPHLADEVASQALRPYALSRLKGWRKHCE
jgi:hypothetical protein